VRLELLAKREPASMDPALGGSERDVESRRDLLVRKAGQIAKDDGLPMLERKRGEGGENPLARLVRFRGRLGGSRSRPMTGTSWCAGAAAWPPLSTR
jgi:hypothetical protein